MQSSEIMLDLIEIDLWKRILASARGSRLEPALPVVCIGQLCDSGVDGAQAASDRSPIECPEAAETVERLEATT